MEGKTIFKETVIMLLISIIAMITFAIIFYEYIPNRKAVAEVSIYTPSEEMQTLLQDNVDQKQKQEVILSYEVTSTDLNNYQKVDEYVPGKRNPFAEVSSKANGTENETTNAGTSGKTEETNTTGYFKNTGTK